MDRITVIPGARKRPLDSLAEVVLRPVDVDACLSCVALRSDADAAAGGGALDAAALRAAHPTTEALAQALARAFQAEPERDAWWIVGPGAAQLYVACVGALMFLYAGERRTVAVHCVDPTLRRLPGWAKGYVWRRQALRRRGFSVRSLIALGRELRTVARSWA